MVMVGEEKDLRFLFGRWEGDDVTSFNWLVYECLDLDTCHVLVSQLN